MKATIATFGRVDILVNNAGGQFPSPAQHISPNGFLAVVKNNLVGTFHMCREVANQWMIPQKGGRIVNVIANIYRGFPGMVHTGAARAGVENMTMTLAVEWSQFGILVNAVAPGIILSSGTAQYPPQLLERAVAETPLKRAGTVEEVAASIVFLCGIGFLPEQAAYDLPALPPIGKEYLTYLCALAGGMIYRAQSIASARPGRGLEALVVLGPG